MIYLLIYYVEILTNEVILCDGEVSASKANVEMAREPRRSCGWLMQAMHLQAEQISWSVNLRSGSFARTVE